MSRKRTFGLCTIDQLVIKEAQGSGGYGMYLKQAHVKLMNLEKNWLLWIYCAANISFICCTDFNKVAERHIDLRPFVLSSPYQLYPEA